MAGLWGLTQVEAIAVIMFLVMPIANFVVGCEVFVITGAVCFLIFDSIAAGAMGIHIG